MDSSSLLEQPTNEAETETEADRTPHIVRFEERTPEASAERVIAFHKLLAYGSAFSFAQSYELTLAWVRGGMQ